MTAAYRDGAKVAWNYGQGTATGRVETVYRRRVTRKIKGSEITRNGSDDCPAYAVKQEDGDLVLKLHSELEKA